MEYEALNFEKVSIAEAKAVLKGEEEKNKVAEDWSKKRQPVLPSDLKLRDSTIVWLMELPVDVRPLHLARKFPRIANKLSDNWTRPLICDGIFEELMIDHRGTRQGFPEEVAKEITSLRGYYNTEVYTPKQDTWTLTL